MPIVNDITVQVLVDNIFIICCFTDSCFTIVPLHALVGEAFK